MHESPNSDVGIATACYDVVMTEPTPSNDTDFQLLGLPVSDEDSDLREDSV